MEGVRVIGKVKSRVNEWHVADIRTEDLPLAK